MNVNESKNSGFGIQHYRRRRAAKRGVSPIIATILLVAITVVLAAVLYVLISGLTSGGGSTPYSLQMSNTVPSQPVAGTFDIAITINPTNGLTTALFGFKVTDINGASIAGVAPGVACIAGATFNSTNCPKTTAASTAWYVVLVTAAGKIANVFQQVAGVSSWTAATTIVSGSENLVIVSGATLDGAGYHMTAFALASASVSGQVLL